MTDLEIKKLCAEAMGFKNVREERGIRGTRYIAYGMLTITGATEFRPLHDDAQAMALVKKFDLCIGREANCWRVCDRDNNSLAIAFCVKGADLNRAICECVAHMQKAKVAA